VKRINDAADCGRMTGNSSIIRQELPTGRNQSARKHYGDALPYPPGIFGHWDQ
jgi:hypothetical protein